MTKIIYREERMGERRRGRPRMGWMEGIESILKGRSEKYEMQKSMYESLHES
jgi:hypothetical protein